ncbi:MAG: proline dehydrogenase family protein [Magnetovibrio sp.]|nr:proline dehydrogenase family protein [Magnetovibrio sp.]
MNNQSSPDHLAVLMFDMEDASVIDDTIALHDGLADQNLPVALTLQAYLKRSEADLKRQIERGAKVRLVKGAFVAGDDIAFTTRTEIKANSRHLIDLMLSVEARETGFYPIIATHDDHVQAYAIEKAQQNGWRSDQYEFEMLLGVRTDVAERMAADGFRVRLYIPFGTDWWPYAIRRIGENPANAVLLARSLVL